MAQAMAMLPLKTILCETAEDFAKSQTIRMDVFVEEQGYAAEAEMDEKDPGSDHLLLIQGEVPIGTVRYYPPMCKLGRLAVAKSGRGTGAGKLLVIALEEHIKARKGKSGIETEGKSEVTIVANAQAYVEGFYAKLGYTREGEGFLEEGEPHVKMVKRVVLDPPEEKS